MNESGQFGPAEEENRIGPALLAVARDLLLEAENLTAIADECGWNRELPAEEAQLASRVEAWVRQVRLLARSIFRTLGEKAAAAASTDPAGGCSRGNRNRPLAPAYVEPRRLS